MSVASIGGWLIGGVMLLVGLGVFSTEIDPLLLCFKQCEIPKALANVLGPGALRLVVGTTFLVLGALFLVPLMRRSGRNRAKE